MTIVITGAGYVGLPLAIALAKYHFVICYDVNKKRIEELIKGYDKNKQHFKKEILQKKLIFTSNTDLLQKKDNGIGFVPNIRNVLAVVFANGEAFLRLMDEQDERIIYSQ